jgi:riboflavin biosynthesis pyrimidine reductase
VILFIAPRIFGEGVPLVDAFGRNGEVISIENTTRRRFGEDIAIIGTPKFMDL